MAGDGAAFFIFRLFLLNQFLGNVPRPTTSFQGKTVIITGASSGLGLEATQHVVKLRATKVIMAVRSVEGSEAAKRAVQESTGCDAGILEL